MDLGLAENTTADPKRCYLEVIGFPCNQFGHQEPSENYELMNTLKYVRPGYGFVPNFPLVGKLEVNGQYESPIFTFLKARCPSPFGLIANMSDISWTPIRNNDLSWNFSKWLIDHTGQPLRRYTPRTDPKLMREDIDKLLKRCEAERQNSGNQQQQNQQQNSTENSNSTANGTATKYRGRRTIIRN